MDNNYQTYLNRVIRLTLPETYESQVQNIQESPKFKPLGEQHYQAVPFPGYTVITPPSEEDTKNSDIYLLLKEYQQRLIQQFDPSLLIPLPVESLHLTLADLIWDQAYRHASENPAFEEKLHLAIAQSFEQYQQIGPLQGPIQMQIVGLMIMPRAVGVCLVPREEDAYNRLIMLRRSIYQNPNVISIGIEQQYNLTAHITLGYFGQIPTDLDRVQLSATCNELNQQWLHGNASDFWVHQAELRKFDDMTRYYREPNWAALEF